MHSAMPFSLKLTSQQKVKNMLSLQMLDFNFVNIDGKAKFGGGFQWTCHNYIMKCIKQLQIFLNSHSSGAHFGNLDCKIV